MESPGQDKSSWGQRRVIKEKVGGGGEGSEAGLESTVLHMQWLLPRLGREVKGSSECF